MTDLLGWLELLALYLGVLAFNICLAKLYFRRWGGD